MRILLVEDDPLLSDSTARALRSQGWVVDCTERGEPVAVSVRQDPYDLLILDVGLAGIDGFETLRRVRAQGSDLPVLMLTARTDEVDFVVGLDAGADDYVGKPFRLAELLARVRALLRRRAPEILDAGGVRMEPSARRVLVDGVEVGLANKEFELLRVLLAHAGQVVSREEILREVWNDPEMKTSKTLDMHMSWLRRKLGDTDGGPTSGKRISTVRGVGFRFNT